MRRLSAWPRKKSERDIKQTELVSRTSMQRPAAIIKPFYTWHHRETPNPNAVSPCCIKPDQTMATTPVDRVSILRTTLSKSLKQTRSRISDEAPSTISQAYGDVASFFASDEDATGVETLVNLLLSKIEKINEDAEGSLDDMLKRHGICSLLERIDTSIAHVDREASEFAEKDEADKKSTLDAIAQAKTQKIANIDGRDKKKRVLPGEYIGYHAYKLKLEHKAKLQQELEEVEKENDEKEKELKDMWESWNSGVSSLEGVLSKMDELGAER